MKYLVIYDWASTKTAFCFDGYNEAVDYINACTDCAGNKTKAVTKIGADFFKMTLKNNKIIWIYIEKYPDEQVRFDLSYDKNGRHVETRRFTRRWLAVNFAHKILDEAEYAPDPGEDEHGEWNIDHPEYGQTLHLTLNLVILSGGTSSDYGTLGIKATASFDEVKQAYRKMAIKYHPDKGGDPKKFQEIHDAYERIMSGKTKSGKPTVESTFNNMDMRYFFNNLSLSWKRTETEFDDEILAPILAEARGKATGLVVRGVLETLIGGALSAMSYNSAKPGGVYFVFTGLIMVGIWSFLKGVYYLIRPKAMLK